MYGVLRKALFTLDPERAHHLANVGLRALHAAARPAPKISPRLATTAFGLEAPGPLGMAAGFDKEAQVYNGLFTLGFDHVEIGTVTPRAQPGNDKPRIQRQARHGALVNRMGFPGPGMEVIGSRLDRASPTGILAANVGPNKDTPSVAVAEDVASAAGHLAPHADFLTVNVSSPNTPGLRDWQTPEGAGRLVQAALAAADDAGAPRPVLLKLHPDATDGELVAVARAAVDAGASGIVAVNTTRARPEDMGETMDGGLSGRPLHERAGQVISALHQGLGRDTPILGVGGVATADDAWAHIQAGATWVQAYTGFIYEGPQMPAKVHAGLLRHLDAAGLDRLDEAIGRA